jgi:hypothetical protein
MSWKCPACGKDDNDEILRCTCGHELAGLNKPIKESNDTENYCLPYDKITGSLKGMVILLSGTLIYFTYVTTKIDLFGPVAEPIEILLRLLIVFDLNVIPILLILLLIKRKRIFRPITILYYFLNMVIYSFAFFVLSSLLSVADMRKVVAQGLVDLLLLIAWTSMVVYLIVSKRAKETLIR